MRYLVAIPLDDRPASDGFFMAQAAARTAGMSAQLASPRLGVWSDRRPLRAPEDEALAIGTIYRDPADDAACRVPGALQLARYSPSTMIGTCWGNFLGLCVTPSAIELVRAPFGTLPVLVAQDRSTLFVASDVALLRSCGCIIGTVDWEEMARHLAATYMRSSATGLTGVRELRGGSLLTVSNGQASISEVWSPWTAAARANRSASIQELGRAIRHTIDMCTAAVARDVKHTLLLLSGGLDSSILAAALRRSNQAFSALTFTTIEPSGDERRYARMVANALNFDLIEVERRLDRVDVARSGSAMLPYPSHRSFQQDSQAATAMAAADFGTELLVEGGGGDNVFCSLQSVTPVVDRLLAREPWRQVWRSACDVARLTDVTAGAILLRALLRLPRKDLLRMPLDTSFLTFAAGDAVHRGPVHPWLVAPGNAWPGSAAHIALLAIAQGWAESSDPLAPIPTVCPLLSRPVVEACLAVPSWQWYEGGQNRVGAREAFRGRLPSGIIDRRSKATPDSFVTRLFERNRQQLRELLLDGLLVANRVVDRGSLERVLAEQGPPCDHRHRRVMRIADAEAWARAQG